MSGAPSTHAAAPAVPPPAITADALTDLDDCLVASSTGADIAECLEEARSSKASSIELADIFSLDMNQDGWDDVRTAIREQLNDRSKAWEQLKEIAKPAGRVAKVLADEVIDLTGTVVEGVPKAGVPSVDVKLPSVDLPNVELKAPPAAASVAGSAALGVLEQVGKARKQAGKPRGSKAASAAAKQPSMSDTIKVGGNLALLFSIPAVTLGLLYAVGAEAFLK
jgi:hypothetical protein